MQAFLRGYRAAGGFLEPPTMAEMVRQAQPNVWWIWFNVHRDLAMVLVPILSWSQHYFPACNQSTSRP